MRVTLYTGNNGSWNGAERLKTWPELHGAESWILALSAAGHDAECRNANDLRAGDFLSNDIILLNISFGLLDRYREMLQTPLRHTCTIVAIHDPALEDTWKGMPLIGEVMSMCDLVLTINANDRGFLQSMTTTPVSYIGYPVPIDAIAAYTVPIADRKREIFLCASAGDTTPFNYLAAKDLGLPMWTCGVGRDSEGNVIPGGKPIQAQPGVEYLGELSQPDFFKRAAQSLLWLDLTHRYTWSRYAVEGACLSVPVIATDATYHNDELHPAYAVSNPFCISGAQYQARKVIRSWDGDREPYRLTARDSLATVRQLHAPEVAIAELMTALQEIGRL
jgi:hypothetical protein